MVVSSCLCRASLQSGHYLKYFETKESRKADSALKGTIDVRQISKLSAGKDGAIAIITVSYTHLTLPTMLPV